MKKQLFYISFIAIAILLAGCKHQKAVSKHSATTKTTQTDAKSDASSTATPTDKKENSSHADKTHKSDKQNERNEKAAAAKREAERQRLLISSLVEDTQINSLYAKIKLSVVFQNKPLSANSTITIIRDSIIDISVQPLLGIELFRVQLTPSGALIIDKMNRQFIRATYSQIAEQTSLNIDFYDIQAACLCQMFVIDADESKFFSSFKPILTEQATDTQLMFSHKNISYTALFDTQTTNLNTYTIQTANGDYTTLSYNQYMLLTGAYYPQQLRADYQSSKQNATLSIDISRIDINQPVSISATRTDRYSESTLNQLFK